MAERNEADAPPPGEEHTEPAWRPEEERGPPLLSRRIFIKRTVQLALAGMLIPGTLAQLLPSLAPASIAGKGGAPIIRRDRRTQEPVPVTVRDLAGEPPVVLRGEWNFLPATLYKVRKSVLEGSSRIRGYNTAEFALAHPTEPENVILLYNSVCKHFGCTVDWNGDLGASSDVPDYNQDGRNDGRILCPCHLGQYDIYDLALNVPGTPPPEPLNVIEFDVIDYTDDLDRRHPGSFFGLREHPQSRHKEASGQSEYDISAEEFEIRDVGWSK